MALSRHFVHGTAWSVMIALIVAFVLATPLLAAAYANLEPYAYYSVVKDKPYAAYTTADEFQRTSPVAYYSVVKDKPYAAYTTADELRRTSTIAYYSVLH